MEIVRSLAQVGCRENDQSMASWLKVAVFTAMVLTIVGCSASQSNGSESAADSQGVQSASGSDVAAASSDSDESDSDESDSDEPDSASGANNAGAVSEVGAEDSSDDAVDPADEAPESVYESPINDLLGRSNAIDAQSQAVRDAESIEREAAVAVCMAAEGFEYVLARFSGPKDQAVSQPSPSTARAENSQKPMVSVSRRSSFRNDG